MVLTFSSITLIFISNDAVLKALHHPQSSEDWSKLPCKILRFVKLKTEVQAEDARDTSAAD